MARILLIDDAAALAELFAGAVQEQCGAEVDVCVAVGDVELFLHREPYDLALVDLSFPQESATGIDALVELNRDSPDTTLAMVARGDSWVSGILRDAWELLPIATVISKSAPLDLSTRHDQGPARR